MSDTRGPIRKIIKIEESKENIVKKYRNKLKQAFYEELKQDFYNGFEMNTTIQKYRELGLSTMARQAVYLNLLEENELSKEIQ